MASKKEQTAQKVAKAVRRWKWKSQGGCSTLTHGGLALLDVLSPFVELSK